MKQEVRFLPISEYQKRFFIEWSLSPLEILYNVSMVNRIKGNLNINALKQASEDVIKSNEVFFARYSRDGNSCQYCNFTFNEFFHELTFDSKLPIELQLRDLLNRPFDLTKDVLVQFFLVQNGCDCTDYFFIMSGHHIIADAVHAQQISIQIQNKYNQLVEGNSGSSWVNKTFSEAVKAEQAILSQEYKANAQKFWFELIGDLPLNVDLPYRSGVDMINFNNVVADKTGESIFFDLSRSQTSQLKAYAKEKKTTLFIIFSALFGLILSKYCNQKKILLSYPVNMRPKGFKEVTGCFVNNVPLKLDFTEVETFDEILEQLGKQRKDAKPFQGYSLTNIIQDQRVNRGREVNSFFNVGFTQTSLNTTSLKLKDLDVLPVDISWNEKIVNEIGLLYDEYSSDVIRFRFEYRKALFDDELIQRIVDSFKRVVDELICSRELRIKEYTLLNQHEYKQIIYHWNETKIEYPKSKTIFQLFQEQVEKSPNEVAAICNNKKLSYAELNEKSNQLARYIRTNFKSKVGLDFTSDMLIPLYMDRSLEVLIGIMAILKAGGAYVPIDVGYPQQRVDYILDNTRAEIILSLRKDIEASGVKLPLEKLIFIDLSEELYLHEDKSNLPVYSLSSNLAYVIYTSGTTGKPKGVQIEHQSLVNYVIWGQKVYVRGEKVSFPLYTSISFDLTITSIFIPLTSGNSVIIYPESSHSLPIEDVITENRVDILKATPSHLKILKELKLFRQENYACNIKRFIVGGESFTTKLASEIVNLFKGNVEIYNEYGPTEATVGCMIYKYDVEKDKNDTVPIGVAIDNAQIYLLDDSLVPVPSGVIGHMYISGDCLARGYLFRPDLTEEKFLKNPFYEGQRMYKTGDVAKRLNNDDIEFIGRKDQQVKINGYRIELDEIEHCIQEYDGIKSAVVLLFENNDSCKICAYYVLDDGGDDIGLREYLFKQLPHYMVPSALCRIERIPLTQNGKVDRDALFQIDLSKDSDESNSAENEIQELLVKVFQDVLGDCNVGINSNFFELGGDSIKAVQITSRLFDKGYSLNVKDILVNQTISRISNLVELTTKEYEQGIISGEKFLTPIEEWFFEQEFEYPNYYNQSLLLEFNKSIDRQIIEKVFKKLIDHHDGLRLNYNPESKKLFFNNDHLNNAFEVEEFEIKVNNTLEDIGVRIKSSFDITSSLLIKAAIIRSADKQDRLLISAHHLVIDGVSWRILLEDLYNLYVSFNKGETCSLPKKSGSLIDWQNALSEYSDTEGLKNQITYWNNVDVSETKMLAETKIQIPDVESQKCAIVIGKKDTSFLLKEANNAYNTDIQILLISALLLSLKERSFKNSLIIELENYGRLIGDIDTSRTIGWFTAIYPIKFDLDIEGIGSYIKHVKEQVRKVPDNGIGYGVLRYTSLKHNISYKHKAEIRFNYLGHFGKELSNDLFTYVNDFTGDEISRNNHLTTNLEVNIYIVDEELNIELIFSKNKFPKSEINIIEEDFKNNLDRIVDYLKHDKDIHFTPSDFDVIDIDSQDLEILFNN